VASASEQIATAVSRIQQQAPKLAKLKLVFGIELTSGGLMGPEKSERFRVELPGPTVSDGAGDDERLQLSIPRTMFDVLAADGQLVDWREAFHYGHLKVEGDARIKRLLGQAIGSS
jgi:hypothetical protein